MAAGGGPSTGSGTVISLAQGTMTAEAPRRRGPAAVDQGPVDQGLVEEEGLARDQGDGPSVALDHLVVAVEVVGRGRHPSPARPAVAAGQDDQRTVLEGHLGQRRPGRHAEGATLVQDEGVLVRADAAAGRRGLHLEDRWTDPRSIRVDQVADGGDQELGDAAPGEGARRGGGSASGEVEGAVGGRGLHALPLHPRLAEGLDPGLVEEGTAHGVAVARQVGLHRRVPEEGVVPVAPAASDDPREEAAHADASGLVVRRPPAWGPRRGTGGGGQEQIAFSTPTTASIWRANSLSVRPPMVACTPSAPVSHPLAAMTSRMVSNPAITPSRSASTSGGAAARYSARMPGRSVSSRSASSGPSKLSAVERLALSSRSHRAT